MFNLFKKKQDTSEVTLIIAAKQRHALEGFNPLTVKDKTVLRRIVTAEPSRLHRVLPDIPIAIDKGTRIITFGNVTVNTSDTTELLLSTGATVVAKSSNDSTKDHYYYA